MKTVHFPPPKRRGLLIHAVIIASLAAASAFGFFNLTRADVGPSFLTALLAALFGFIPIPFFTYRAFTIQRADYVIDRNSLSIHWGLRVEQIPLTDIEWMRLSADLTHPVRVPPLAFSGGLMGLRRHPDLGTMEFLASDKEKLVLVATSRRVFVISPDDPGGLMQAFARATELGSLSPVEARSVFPSFVIGQAWNHAPARFLWLSSILINVGLFVWVSLLIPTVPRLALRLQTQGNVPEAVPSTQLILLPSASFILFVAGWLAGLYFYRWDKERVLALIVWTSSTLTSLLFLVAIFFIVTTPV